MTGQGSRDAKSLFRAPAALAAEARTGSGRYLGYISTGRDKRRAARSVEAVWIGGGTCA